jgi:hypothetical protein
MARSLCFVCEMSAVRWWRAGGGSDTCDADAFVCCYKRGGREMLGLEWS